MSDSHHIVKESLPALRAAAGDWLATGKPTVIAAAPGRLDVMGGIADYSGAVVLEATIGALAVAAIQRRDGHQLRVRTVGPEVGRLARTEFSIDLALFYADGRPRGGALKPYETVRALFPPDARWAAYVLGTVYVLLAERVLTELPTGLDLLLHSTVPLGAGVASSAAIEVAAMSSVLAAAAGAPLDGMRLAVLCQVVENRVAGAPCGIMDQVTSVLGQARQLLALRCQPHEVLGWHAPPAGFTFAGLDSGVKHAVGGARYPVVRCAAFMGRRIIQAHLAARGEGPAKADYLCNLTPDEYRARFRDLLPARLTGREFVTCWGETGDSATSVDPAQTYPVRGATEHPIYENARVLRFVDALDRAAAEHPAIGRDRRRRHAIRRAGRLMFGSHRSYSRNCGLGAKETDLLVALVRGEGPDAGLFGAKITGGGSGGTVAVLLEAAPDGTPSDRAAAALDRIGSAYAEQTGRRPRLITGSLPGAQSIPPLHVRW